MKKSFSPEAYKLALESVDKRIETIETKIDGSVIKAPEDGYVTMLIAKTGMTAFNIEPLITVATVEDGLQVVLNVTQSQATWFAKDDKINVYIPLLNRTFDGYVSGIKSVPSGGMLVEADISDPSGDIPAGQLAKVSFTKMSEEYLTTIPLSALHNDGYQDYIYKIETVNGPLGDEYRLYKVYVRVIDQDDTNVALEVELDYNDRIVTESDQALYGGRVKLRKE